MAGPPTPPPGVRIHHAEGPSGERRPRPEFAGSSGSGRRQVRSEGKNADPPPQAFADAWVSSLASRCSDTLGMLAAPFSVSSTRREGLGTLLRSRGRK